MPVLRIMQWRMSMEDSDIKLQYLPGEQNILADCFSQLPQMEEITIGNKELEMIQKQKGKVINWKTLIVQRQGGNVLLQQTNKQMFTQSTNTTIYEQSHNVAEYKKLSAGGSDAGESVTRSSGLLSMVDNQQNRSES